MADPEAQIETPTEEEVAEDVEMGGDEADAGAGEGDEATMLADIEQDVPEMTTFLDYLKSPIVELVVGTGDNEAILSAHQGMLVKSPWFAEQCAQFNSGGPRRIELASEDLTAVGSVLEYLYNGEYFPKRVNAAKDSALENDPTVSSPDNEGVALLRHARVYTLASKFSLPQLKSLAHAKIHRTESTARGEIAYARFVYKETSREDNTIRKPVAAFWAMRSHVLRHEAEDEFRSMCLEFPQFGFDVLSLVLDAREKQKEPSSGTPVVHAGRKRARVSQG
ncbi:hypothetical protein EJ08DRAFT_652380 [Tothia fuscella]|uniref:BTB domain-containing protein n=1 Tax=Tothia fuscella TaxID=1048955 RepID=A0A9P4NK88_9PEZI|nr:hypothetical protein EJ08DRAFT_652380 [Tothia fuscella]